MVYQFEESVIQNLKAAGCNQSIIDEFLYFLQQEKTEEQLQILFKQRQYLLDTVHEGEKNQLFRLSHISNQK